MGDYIIRLTDQEFSDIVTYIKTNYGINLAKKRQLIEARMYSILQEKHMSSFTEYFRLIRQNNPHEISMMLNKLTTNHTYFMREPAHFEFLQKVILPYHEKNNRMKRISIWSAGCSSGEEAYTTVMYMLDYFGLKKNEWNFTIQATDISLKAMEAAKNNLYPLEALKDISPAWIRRFFIKQGPYYVLSDEVKSKVTFKRFNLMDPFIFPQSFDLIFCRNVMIYFDQPTKNQLINKFYTVLKPGGYLFIGHSESVQRDTSKFMYIQPSIYQKG